MNNDVKRFIEKNIKVIEDEAWDDLYDQAYEHLTGPQTGELTDALFTALNEDLEQYAKDNIIKQFDYLLDEFVRDNSRNGAIYLSTVVKLGMNHINGLEWDEFQLLVEQHLEDDPRVIVDNDGIDLFITKRGK